jgi:hypothetical protein
MRLYPGALYVWLTCEGKVVEDVDMMLGEAPRLALLGEELEETRDSTHGEHHCGAKAHTRLNRAFTAHACLKRNDLYSVLRHGEVYRNRIDC